MKITNIDSFIEEFKNGRDIWSRASIELAVREISRLRNENQKLKLRLAASENDLVLIEVNEMLKKTQARVQELEEKYDLVLSERNYAYDNLHWAREISVDEFITKSKLKKRITELEVKLKSKEIVIESKQKTINEVVKKLIELGTITLNDKLRSNNGD